MILRKLLMALLTGVTLANSLILTLMFFFLIQDPARKVVVWEPRPFVAEVELCFFALGVLVSGYYLVKQVLRIRDQLK